jgi:hypothetical protein
MPPEFTTPTIRSPAVTGVINPESKGLPAPVPVEYPSTLIVEPAPNENSPIISVR